MSLSTGDAARSAGAPAWRQLLGDLVRIDPRKSADKLLILLLVTDAVLIALHLVRAGTGLFADWNYAIDVERGFGETLQYVKLGWLVVILPLLAVRLRSGQFACWAVIALVLLYDDMFSARERYGQVLALAQGWEGAFGIRGQDLGEFVFIGLYGVVVLACAALAYRYSRGGDRRFWWEMGVLLVALVGFGIVVDMIHVLVIGQEPWDLLLATIEDGGEMVVASLMVRLTFERWDRTDQPLAGAARFQA